MRGLWIEKGRAVYRDDLPAPRPAPGDALLRVRLAGVCATDLELMRGYMSFAGVAGHEFVAEVVEAAPDLPAGTRVVGEINVGCGTCETCRGGQPGHCPHRTVLGLQGRGGAFAELLALPLRNLHRVPASVSDRAAVLVEPLAAALEVLEQVKVQPVDRVLVVGAGRLGQLLARSLALTGCRLRVVARHARQRALLEAHGVAWLDEAQAPRATEDLVVEATGSPAGLALSLGALRPRGTLVLKSTYADQATLDLSRMVVDEITLVGSRCGPFPRALRLIEDLEIDPTDLLEGCLPLERGEEALVAAARPGALKWLLQP